jgi:hypothetical protein
MSLTHMSHMEKILKKMHANEHAIKVAEIKSEETNCSNKLFKQEKRIEKDWEIIRKEQETIMQLIAENRQLKCTIKQYKLKR